MTSLERHIAVESFRKTGYITDKEAEVLNEQYFTVRNECTTIRLVEANGIVYLYCSEVVGGQRQELFMLSLDKNTGVIKEYITRH